MLLFAMMTLSVAAATPADDNDAAKARSSSCVTCHVNVAASFALSGHAQARSSFVFDAAVAVEDPTWCVSCHAPRSAVPATRSVRNDADLDDRGIGCVACHAPSRAHMLSSPTLCAQCHQFGFLRRDASGRPVGLTDDKNARDAQQNTFAEWRAWSSSTGDTRTCQSCHMKDGDHSFGGVRRMEALRDALVVEPDTARDRRDRGLRIRARDTGHPLPTGDIMRFISVEVARDDAFADSGDVTVVARFRRDVALRVWAGDDDDGGAHAPAPRLGVVRDVRIPPTGEPVFVAVPSWARAWRVIYHLVSEEQEQRELLPADVSRIVVMQGAFE